jgi:O-6-methylguanine DNA methyltransferase
VQSATEKPKHTKTEVRTEAGTFVLETSDRGLYAVRFPATQRGQAVTVCLSPLLRKLRHAKLDLRGCTDFQKRVYRELLRVSAGETVSYAELAKRAGYPGAARAVGSAMKKNRLPIAIPCHRVVPASGPNTYQFPQSGNWGRPNYHSGKKIKSLGGGMGEYSAGRRWKRLLLEYERWDSSIGTRESTRNEKPKRVPGPFCCDIATLLSDRTML